MTIHEWREEVGRRAGLEVESDPGVLAAFYYGSSVAVDTMDRWSDVDLLYVVTDAAFERFDPLTRWLGDLRVFSVVRETNIGRRGIRVCFDLERRLDITVRSESSALVDPPHGLRLIAGRWPGISSDLALKTGPRFEAHADHPYDEDLHEFLHKFQLAVVKIMRGDLLIGSHLALQLYEDALVILMKRRDNELGTNHHRRGGHGNNEARALLEHLKPDSDGNLLESLRSIGLWLLSAAGEGQDAKKATLESIVSEARKQLQK